MWYAGQRGAGMVGTHSCFQREHRGSGEAAKVTGSRVSASVPEHLSQPLSGFIFRRFPLVFVL